VKKQFIKDLKSNIPVEDVFYLVRRDIKERRDGAPFMTFQFRDRTGSVNGIMWDRVEDAMKCVEPGGFYHVQAKLGDYQGKPQLTVSVIYPADEEDINRDDFITASKYDRDEMMKRLREYIDGVKNTHLKTLLDAFFNDEEFVREFANSPAAVQVHHAYIGGLLEHTLFMCRMGEAAAATYKEVDADLLMTGIILHDVGKTVEYVYDSAIEHSWDGRLHGHIVIGYRMVLDRIRALEDFPEDLARELLHIILSHHGLMEFGSPKTPKFTEALIVHFLDNLDARAAMFREATEKDPGVRWTDFHRFLETNIYQRDTGN